MVAVKPEVLVWARERSGYSFEEAARKVFQDTARTSAVEKLKLLERGKRKLTQKQLMRLANAWHQPLLVFYLPQPPRDGDFGEDFRTAPEAGFDHKQESHLRLLMRNMASSQGLMSNLLEEDEGAEPLPFLGSMGMDDGVEAVAEAIVAETGFDLGDFRAQKDIREAFKYLRSRLEYIRIFVLLQSNLGSYDTEIGPEVFRGFALADAYAPYIVINRGDAVSAWSFTALHEAAHLWLGKSGISAGFGEQAIEQFCNRVAASILLPAHELEEMEGIGGQPLDEAAAAISDYARACKVSRAMVAYNLLLCGKISRQRWQALSARFKAEWQESKAAQKALRKGKTGGPNFYTVKRYNLGPALTGWARYFLSGGDLTSTSAGVLLGVRAGHVYPLLDTNFFVGRS